MERELEMKNVMFKEKELELNSKVDGTVTSPAQVKLTFKEKEVCCKARDSVTEKIDKAAKNKVAYEAKLLNNDQLALSYKIEIGAIEEMKGEIRVLEWIIKDGLHHPLKSSSFT